MEKEFFAQQLLRWYERQHRDLPWRRTQNPYFIWLSEIILQQTRVKQGLPYYLRFVETFPTVEDLARAEEKEVLRLWQGLGYYSRARNMHATARLVASQYQGNFPDKYTNLLKLKGIGTYTAAAIASFAFGERTAVLDGNVYRVLARVFGIETDIAGSEAKKVFSGLANELLPEQRSDIYNQAIMEFGAVQCTPANPDCMFCPLNTVCVANLTGRQAQLPVKSRKVRVKERFFHYLVLQQEGRIYMKERQAKDIWQGLYDFYLKEADRFYPLDALALEEEWRWLTDKTLVKKESEIYTHILTHQRVRAKFWHLELSKDVKLPEIFEKSFYSIAQIQELPKPILINNYLNSHFF